MSRPEFRMKYILEASPRRVRNRLLRDVLTHDADGRPAVVVEVPNAVAVDVLDAVRAAYQQGREDHAEQYSAQLESACYALARAALTELRWAPYQEFGIPDQAAEVAEPPAGRITVGATGYRGNRIIIYWQAGVS